MKDSKELQRRKKKDFFRRKYVIVRKSLNVIKETSLG